MLEHNEIFEFLIYNLLSLKKYLKTSSTLVILFSFYTIKIF